MSGLLRHGPPCAPEVLLLTGFVVFFCGNLHTGDGARSYRLAHDSAYPYRHAFRVLGMCRRIPDADLGDGTVACGHRMDIVCSDLDFLVTMDGSGG